MEVCQILTPARRVVVGMAALGLASFLVGTARADTTRRWEFTTPDNYDVSDPIDIEVADGEARLLLQADRKYDAARETYYTNGTERSAIAISRDASIIRGVPYGNPAMFTSRVLDNKGGLWERIHSKFQDRPVENAGGAMSTNYLGLLHLYHFENSLRDEVTGEDAIAGAAMTFSTSARVGTHSADFAGMLQGSHYARIPTAALLNGATEWTICCWVKRREDRMGGIVGAFGAVHNGLYGSRADTSKAAIYVNANYLTGNSSIALNEWVFLAATWRSSDGQWRQGRPTR